MLEPAYCRDCGTDTTPCTGKRGCRHTGKWEWYGVHAELWLSAGMEHPFEGGDGFLCIGCLEKRIGRRLTPADFIHIDDHPWDTPRLKDRQGILATTDLGAGDSN